MLIKSDRPRSEASAAVWQSLRTHLNTRLCWDEGSYPIAQLEKWARGVDAEAAGENLELGEYLEPMLMRVGWWVTVADLALAETGPLPLLRSLLADLLGLVPAAWGNTLIHARANGAAHIHLLLLAHYVNFRRVVLEAIAAAWPGEDLNEFRQLA